MLARDGVIVGFVDVGEARFANVEVDLAAATWSLHYNLGPGWGATFLRAYGWEPASEAEADRLRLTY